jgi:hypothetical protein
MIKGSCLCGNVKIEIAGAVHNARFCHCANCRKFSGAAYAAWGLVQTDQMKVLPPDSGVSKYNSGGGLRVFCTSCGSPLWYEPDGRPQYRGIPLGIIDEGEVPTPGMHVWTKSRVDWASTRDGIKEYDTHP